MNQIELGTILHMEKGKKPKKQSTEMVDGFFPYVDIKAFEKGIVDSYASPEKCVLCDDGDLLIVCDGSRSGLTGRAIKGVVGSTLSKISADGLKTEYLRYFIQSKYKLLNTRKKGTGTPHLNVQILKQSKLIVPTLPGQERIVSRIEELFSELDKAVETLKTTKQQLAVYRQAELKEAFAKAYSTGELYEICQVCSDIKVGIVIKPSQYYTDSENGIKAFRSANVREFYIENKDWVYLSNEGHEANMRSKLHTGDVVIVRSGYPGTACVITDEYDGCNAIDILIAVPNKEMVLSEYLCAFTNSPDGRAFVRKKKRGVAQSHLNVSGYSKIKIPVPSIIEQKQIVQDIDNHLSICNSIEKTVDTALQQAEAMRQSILKKAFEGDL